MGWELHRIKPIPKSLAIVRKINCSKRCGGLAFVKSIPGGGRWSYCSRSGRRKVSSDNLFFVWPLIFKNKNRSCNRHAQRQWGVVYFWLVISISLSPSISNSQNAGIVAGKDVVLKNVTSKPPLDRARQKAKDVQKRLEITTSEIESIAESEARVLNQLNRTERSLSQIHREMTAARSDLKRITTEIDTHLSMMQHLEKKIIDREAYLSNRLEALYKLSWLGELSVLAAADSSIDFFRRKAGFEFVLAYDQAELEHLEQEKKTHTQMLRQLKLRQLEKRTIETRLGRQEDVLAVEWAEKGRLLAQIKARKKLQMAAAAELKRAAVKLEETIRSLSEPSSKYSVDPRRGERDFSSFKGLLNLPVKGKIIYFYGRYKDKRYNVVNFRTGITIQAERGEPIRSVGSGIAIFADWFRGYGNMIIIDHGNHYYTVYAYLEEFFKSKGDRIETDEVIATVGDVRVNGRHRPSF